MALALPRANVVVFAPLGAVALFWAWFGAPPGRAFRIGWLAGIVYFAISFTWFGETAGALIAPFGFLLALGPALVEGFLGFALVGALVAIAARGLASRERSIRAFVPLAAAAIFAFGEWVRSEGLGEVGVPLADLGYTQVGSPLAPLGAYVGTYGITFAICLLAAYAAYAVRMRYVRASGVDTAVAFAVVALVTTAAWAAWPARDLGPATYRVAAIQGNIPQHLKFSAGALPTAVERYVSLTREAAATRPNIILWPETVIPVALARDPALGATFSALARDVHAELVVGTYDATNEREYNVLDYFSPAGTLERSYRKRRLVPFAEHIPGRAAFAWIPWTANVSNFSEGTREEIVRVGSMDFGAAICWESAFSAIARDESRDGAQALLISTDDAWFGTSAGPFQHAQIAQMRAIETGRYVVRAASTGVSGIIAPDGRYRRETRLNHVAIVSGAIGAPVWTVFDTIGSPTVAAILAALYVVIIVRAVVAGRAERRRYGTA